ncbi:dimethylglycine dehydrogenase [Limimonas halophila]|uniref:Dimethylglycine dehydrogenase n=1 Tax=Limimonas halophila TaxID=1082479 RepID=A0A1G7L3V8_9PROT|nr:FAD-dependent oxidoreductase [Limimonas halophila]SDF43689.1 dimethylglycine dehydrogenase [Limimonas halophila]
MQTHADVVVIGGGVVGCSVLYHLAKAGWTNPVLIEKSELTAGSTWHAAGGMHTLNGNTNVATLQKYTIDLYRQLEEESGQSCGIHITGGVMLAADRERMDFLRQLHAKGRYLGMDTELLDAAEAARRFPLMDPQHFVGALYDPLDGHVSPADVTHAYAKAARTNGATIHRHTSVDAMHQKPDGTWRLETSAGPIECEHVVNAAGLWAREMGRMAGVELPVQAMEHMYVITDDMPEVAEINESTGEEVLHAIDFSGEIYMRQERGGMLMGTYEKNPKAWAPHSTPWDFEHELLAPDFERITPSLEKGFEHFPALQNAGLKQVINGPFTFAPDGNPLVGPVRGLTNYWVACGVMAGFSQGGGVGLALANWMTHGDPGFDIWGMDVARFGDWCRPAYTREKVRETYARRFSLTYPNEELPAGRPLKTTPVYEKLKRRNAVFGAAYGMEQALWFAPEGETPEETPTFRRSNAFAPVGAECRAVRESVGLIEVSGFAKYEITGPEAAPWLDHLLAGKLPREGRLTLCPMLNPAGTLKGDFTLARLGPEHFVIFGAGAAQDHHMRWFRAQQPAGGGVEITSHGLDWVGLSLAGPRARAVLQSVTDADVSNDAFRFLGIQAMDLGMIPALVGRVSFTGELGYEIWVKPEYQNALFDLLMEAGAAHGLRLFGGRALNSLRLEKSFGSWATEYRPVYGPAEAGMSPFVALSKGDFIGREGARREQAEGPKRQLITLTVDADGADPGGDEPITHDGTVVGWVTSGGYAHTAGTAVALGYVAADHAGDTRDGAYSVEILGEQRPATLQPKPLVDPEGTRLRS